MGRVVANFGLDLPSIYEGPMEGNILMEGRMMGMCIWHPIWGVGVGYVTIE